MTPEEASRLTAVEERSKSNTHRLDTMESKIDAINRLATNIPPHNLTEVINGVKDDVVALSGKVEAIEQKPAKKWDGLVEKIAKAVIAALVGYLFARVGLV